MIQTEKIKKTCVNCTLKYLFRFHSFVGHFPFNRRCTHNGYLTSSYKTSPILVAVSYLYAILLLSTTCYEFYGGFDTEISVWKVENITALGYLLLGVCNSLTIMFMNSYREIMKLIINTFSLLLNSSFSPVKIEEKEEKFFRLRRRSMMYISISVFSTILGTVLPYLSTKRIISFIATLKIYLFCANCYTTTISIDGITVISELFFDSLTGTLKSKISGERTSICNNLKTLLKQRFIIQKVMRTISRYATPTVTIFYPLILLFSFCALYVAIIEAIHMAISQNYSASYILWPFILFSLHYASQSNTTLLELDDAILSYLYRVPMSKLTRKERNQVELLILTLRVHPLVVTPSNMFDISKKLYITSQYIVVTFVITGLQFYFSISKEP